MKLKESIAPNEVKIIELYNKIVNGLLNTQPNYQRKLVWKKQHKFAFIDTILLNFPFPEIYIASSEIDVENMIASEVVVDGQQRLTTIVEYIKGEGDFTNQKKVPNFNDLTPKEKKEFLNYKVSVKDLKDIGEDLIKEIFQRINSTEYSLNTVEKNNAQFGDGEIALFCKQLVDSEYIATDNETDIIVEPEVKEQINDFFSDKKIFTQNDLKRMYDFQYVMLLTSTILEGSYYSRSTKVHEYLEKFNSSFTENETISNVLLQALKLILKLNLSEKSYWYNKANLFTLIIELTKSNMQELNTIKLELELLKLEDKVDLFFSAEDEEDIIDIAEDERKYFQDARHGSHEKAAREHRGKVIKAILDSCLIIEEIADDSIEKNNLNHLKLRGIDFASITPTQTGLNKSIMDAVYSIRQFLLLNRIHDYDSQEFGPKYKVKLKGVFFEAENKIETEVSLYRSNGRGDFRIWFSGLNKFADPNDELTLIIDNDESLGILNLSKYDYREIL